MYVAVLTDCKMTSVYVYAEAEHGRLRQLGRHSRRRRTGISSEKWALI